MTCRYIGECTRLTYDLLQKVDEEDMPGSLVLLDIEKAFDSLEWKFICKTLKCLGFGDTRRELTSFLQTHSYRNSLKNCCECCRTVDDTHTCQQCKMDFL